MDRQQTSILRQRVEREIRGILRDEYGLNVDADTPVRYYLDFKTNRRLLEFRDALEMIERGTFGICMICGSSISYSRLAESPAARLCDSCAPAKHDPTSVPASDRIRTVHQQHV